VNFGALLARVDGVVLDHLGDAVTYTSGAGASVAVRGPFDAVYVKVEAGEAGVSSSGPSVFLRLTDLTSNPETDLAARVSVAGVVYEIREVEPDGKGGIRLLLHEV
jgi:hypothetical protein